MTTRNRIMERVYAECRRNPVYEPLLSIRDGLTVIAISVMGVIIVVASGAHW